MPPAALYVHVPFCVSRCRYCSFASSVYDKVRARAYLAALRREVAMRAQDLSPHTVYIGGGTPTSLPQAEFRELVEIVSSVKLHAAVEYTVEANPGTLTMQKLLFMRRAGVSRISIGVQSFSDEGLSVLGRAHSAKQARTAIAVAREAGFDDVSVDLIYGWPGQTPDAWQTDMERAAGLGIQHLSCYPLSYEPGTELEARVRQGRISRLGEDLERELFDLTATVLAGMGRPRYELSSFAGPGHECLHNMNYWTGGEYIGVGCAAHSHLAGERFANASGVDDYIRLMEAQGCAKVFAERLDPERSAREILVIWLRLTAGVEVSAFAEQTGFRVTELIAGELPELVDGGWLEWSEDRSCLRLTPQAIPVADSVLGELVG